MDTTTNQADKSPVVDAAVDLGVTPQLQPNAPEADPEARILALQAELDKTRSDRDNYRTGLLKAKGRITNGDESVTIDYSDPEQLAEFIKKTVAETENAKDYQQKEKAFTDYATQVARENKELKATLASRNASTSIGGGSGAGASIHSNSEVNNSYFSPEQVEELKKRGMSEEAIKKVAFFSQVGPQSGQTMR